MRIRLSILVVNVAALSLCLTLGCNADKGKDDPGLSARTSAVVPAATQPSLPDTPEATDTRPMIICFGDSITAGLGVDPAKNYPANLQRELDSRGLGYRVLNMGVSGETTKDGLARVPRVLSHNPAWVIVEFGGNDGLRGLRVADSQQNLLAIVSALRKGGTRVLIAGITLPTQYGPDYISHFEAIFPAVAKQANVPLLPFSQFAKGLTTQPGNLQDDGIHPTASGDAILARNVASALAPMLKH